MNLVSVSLASSKSAREKGLGTPLYQIAGDTATPNQFFTPPVAGVSSKVMNI